MPAAGPRSPGTIVSVDAPDPPGGTGIAWTNPTNAATEDGTTWAEALIDSGPQQYSKYLKATNFGFTVPSGATIDGVQVDIKRRDGGASGTAAPRDQRVRLVRADGTLGTTDKADTVNDWPADFTYKSYGGAADKWGETLTPADVNDVDFGVVLMSTSIGGGASERSRVDHIRITVHYSEPATGSAASATQVI